MDHDAADPMSPIGRTIEQVWADDRAYVYGMAFRMLGQHAEAEDVVQEAFGRLAQVPLAELDDPRGWLVVVMRRLCLDRLRSAHARRESASGADPTATTVAAVSLNALAPADPADRVTLDDQVQRALAVVLDRLTPAERTSFVLHDVFGFSFDGIAEIVGRTPAACRQLASRARRTVREGAAPSRRAAPDAADEHRVLTERFIAACAGGDLSDLMEVLDPEIVGVATLIGDGRRGFQRLQGRPVVARRLLAILGPETKRVLVPVPVEGSIGFVVLDAGRPAALLVLGESGGLIDHIETFVNGLTRWRTNPGPNPSPDPTGL
ncbi:MAG: polymerase subunit sigma [Ilumatobacteraceae bacterium]|nr:polymerase subunit sigma [Ilumatobacteraceae bacterium]